MKVLRSFSALVGDRQLSFLLVLQLGKCADGQVNFRVNCLPKKRSQMLFELIEALRRLTPNNRHDCGGYSCGVGGFRCLW